MTLTDAQAQLGAMLEDRSDVHVTEFAAACLRAVDSRHLAHLLTDWDQRRHYVAIRKAAEQVVADSPAPGSLLSEPDKRALAALRRTPAPTSSLPDDAWSLFARAVAQAVYQERHKDFWSYFADWSKPRKLEEGDPVPVPTRTRLEEIYAAPALRCCPSPDLLLGPQELCPGGYRGLPSLRLLDRPEGCPADVYLDPSLDEAVCPLSASKDCAGKVTIIVPSPDLGGAFDISTATDEDGVPGFGPIRPKDLDALRRTIVEAVERAADASALIIAPEFSTAPEVDDALDRLHDNTGIGNIEVLVGGSAWREPEAGATLGANRATTWPRGRGPHHHDKYSWFSSKKTGHENITRAAPRITIMAGPRTTYTVLICRDALEPWVPALLQDLRLRLVLIPSCNPDVGPYRVRAESLAELGASTVVVANLPPKSSESIEEYGLVVRPASPSKEGRSAQPESLVISGYYARSFHVDIRQGRSFSLDRTVRRS